MFNTAFLIILCSGCAMNKNRNTALPMEQKWTFSREVSLGTGSGNSWSFSPNGRFTEVEWYSGGGYWTHHYSGTYFYDADNKTVFIKYDRNKAPHLKKRLSLIITENDTTLRIACGWKPTKKISLHDQQCAKINKAPLGKYTFKIEKSGDQ